MPYVSDETVTWANHVLSTGSAAARKAMLTTNAVLPPAGGIDLAAIGHSGRKFDDVVTQDYSKLKIGAAADSIMFIKLRPVSQNEIGAMTFATKRPSELPTTASRQGWTAVWWLPWQGGHIVKIKIRSVLADPTINCGTGVAPVDNPSVFFTAAINGCSVFAVGDSKAPSMYHGGVDGTMTARNTGELTEAAWRRLLGRLNTTKNLQSVGKTDYISELNPTRADDSDRTMFSTTASRAFEQSLNNRGSLTNVSVRPWGMVFGVRDVSGDWTMTLVKNSQVSYRRIQLISKKKVIGAPKQVQVVRGEIRDNRSYNPDATLRQSIATTAEQDIQYCYTLGWQDFFPGQGNAYMHNLNNIQVF